MYTNKDHTFIVCAYGDSPYLEQCVKSLVAQTIDSRILMSTSTPNDSIQSIAKKYNIPIYINDGKPSISHDWNCALSHCDTSLATIAHQDDIYLSNYVSCMLDSMNSAPNPLIFFSNYGELRDGEQVDSSLILNVKRFLLRGIESSGYCDSFRNKRRLISFGSSICCPSVTFNLNSLPSPVFLDNMKCDLDWEAWERFSRLDGSFVYSDEILMRHRIHEGSETTASIEDDTRRREDLEMLFKFWPKPVAILLNAVYSMSMKSNSI